MYKLSAPLALILTLAALIFCGHFIGSGLGIRRRVNLYEIARHGVLEHNASLCHADASQGARYAPVIPDPALLAQTVGARWPEGTQFPPLNQSRAWRLLRATLFLTERSKHDISEPTLNEKDQTSFCDLVWARYLRDKEERPLHPLHGQIAYGEIALASSVFTTNPNDKVEDWKTYGRWMHIFFSESRLPFNEGWESPKKAVTLINATKITQRVKGVVEHLKEQSSLTASSSLEKI